MVGRGELRARQIPGRHPGVCAHARHRGVHWRDRVRGGRSL